MGDANQAGDVFLHMHAEITESPSILTGPCVSRMRSKKHELAKRRIGDNAMKTNWIRMMSRSTSVACIAILCVSWSVSQVYGEYGESQYEVSDGLVEGGSFMDLIEPLPARGDFRSDVWGGDNVIPRDVENGIEGAEYSYWGGNVIKDDDGKYHMFVCRWPENSYKGEVKQGHALWWSSVVVHAVSDNALGPFKVVREIGRGHNPEIYRRKDGSYVVGVMGDRAYTSPTLNGPWTEIKATFQWLDDSKPQNKNNRTYVVREDGSGRPSVDQGGVHDPQVGEDQ